eukprot:gene6807-7912_t
MSSKRTKRTTTTTTTTAAPKTTSTRSTKKSRPSQSYDSLSNDQQIEIQEAYNLFKRDEVKYAFRAIGVEPKKENITALSEHLDDDNNITFDAFKEIASSLIPTRDSQPMLEQGFKLFDKDNSGRISFDDLKAVMVNLGEECSDEDLHDMIRFADMDGDGEISKAEFITLMTSNKMAAKIVHGDADIDTVVHKEQEIQ